MATTTSELQAIEEIAERLSTRFPGTAPAEVFAVVRATHHGFDGRPIRDFVPVLVERAAGDTLRIGE